MGCGLWLAGARLGAAPVRTGFDPPTHGFLFANTFTNDVIADIRTGGLCGGMSYSAADYYLSKAKTPRLDYRPAVGSTLAKYLYGRQVNSIMSNLDKWAEVGFNPGGARDAEFFRWGLQAQGRIKELKARIDAGLPVPLGLQEYGGHGRPASHQVLAIGYDMGRYKGDLKGFQTDFKIFVYDPNFPGRTMTMGPDLKAQGWKYQEEPDQMWRTYFVDMKYAKQKPPAIAEPALGGKDGLLRELLVELRTGEDDLRGGSNDNVAIEVQVKGKPAKLYPNVNLSARWISNYSQTVSLPLVSPIRPEDLLGLTVRTKFTGGFDGDNWNVDWMKVRVRGGGIDRIVYERAGSPLVRFTGQVHAYAAKIVNAVEDGLARELVLVIRTGGDDLRGGNDNVDVVATIDGATASVKNANKGTRWGDHSDRTVVLSISKPVKPEAIRSVKLVTGFGGGMGGDNWNVDRLQVTAKGGGKTKVLFDKSGSPLVRFTGSVHEYVARCR